MSDTTTTPPAAGGGSELSHLESVELSFRLTVEEGVHRLERTWPALLATGFVGGIDVSIGVFGLLVVLNVTDGNTVLGALAFSIGFVALTLAKSELFTENFLVPIAAVVAARPGPRSVARLWTGTAAMNLLGGWVVAALVISGFPEVRDEAVELGQHFVELGIGWRSFAMAILAGAMITVMTWMIEGTTSPGPKLVAAVVTGFLLAAGEINHCIVASLEMFAGIIAGAPYGYADWLGVFVWAALGNTIGGVGLVTILRFIQVGGREIRATQAEKGGGKGGGRHQRRGA